ncbi:ankyrin repeat-containing protein BDA1-like [Ziziphus jujuba]|uniref:Ankyrin repeat-containing protein BDA1-like n=1 Tax=Ziziphus jujuba TaxID=326968 RepID=A0A6P6FSP4_ZIZJJ|nr:ankyrin repeat-containing protein BDA1-like [Ziziphus jujuba]
MEIRPYEDDIAALFEASQRGCISTLNTLVERDPLILDKLSLTSLTETPLHISALLGHLAFTQILLTLRPKLATELDIFKRTPLHLAAAKGYKEIVQELLRVNHHLCNLRDQDGRAPLHYAVMKGRVGAVESLICGCPESILMPVDGEETVLHLCVKYNQLECLKLLVQSQSDNSEFLNQKDEVAGNTILHLAAMFKQIETVRFFAYNTKSGRSSKFLESQWFYSLRRYRA